MTYEEFTKETLHIFTLVTGPYVNYFDNFLNTVENFFPDNKKVIHITSDGLSEYNNASFEDKNIERIEVWPIVDLPFPLIPMQKTYMQKHFAGDDVKFIYYFDIDTIFIKREIDFWKWMCERSNGNVIMSIHPHYDSQLASSYINLVEKNELSEAFIPNDQEPHNRVISSFWGGDSKSVLRMCDYVNAMFKKDLGNLRYLPRFVDENYINKIIWMVNTGKINDLSFYSEEHLVETTYHFFNIETPKVFLFQKYDIKIKELKKNVD